MVKKYITVHVTLTHGQVYVAGEGDMSCAFLVEQGNLAPAMNELHRATEDAIYKMFHPTPEGAPEKE